MANIMITSKCNLNCPYCFAKEKMCDEEMSIENFDKAINFILNSGDKYAGIIGGEPTLHSNFEKILRYAINSPLNHICIFTNLTYIDNYIDLISNYKIKLLVNFNDRTSMRNDAYDRMCKRLIDLKQKYENNQVTLGLNIYNGMPPEQLPDIVYFAKYYKMTQVRVTPSVPSLQYLKENSILDYFKEVKQVYIDVCNALDSVGVTIKHDCNFIPKCVFTEQEIKHLDNLSVKYNIRYIAEKICRPVIDIMPNLDVIRCFGVSTIEGSSLNVYKNLNEITGHFLTNIDELLRGMPISVKCFECKQRKYGCNMGCLRAKIFRLEACKAYYQKFV